MAPIELPHSASQVIRMTRFCEFLVAMDEPDDPAGRANRQVITLNRIIELARWALGEPQEGVQYPPPAPTPNDQPLVRDAVLADLVALCERRRKKYGTHLQPGNGRDGLQDLYEELVDAVLYTKQILMEDEISSTHD